MFHIVIAHTGWCSICILNAQHELWKNNGEFGWVLFSLLSDKLILRPWRFNILAHKFKSFWPLTNGTLSPNIGHRMHKLLENQVHSSVDFTKVALELHFEHLLNPKVTNWIFYSAMVQWMVLLLFFSIRKVRICWPTVSVIPFASQHPALYSSQ